MNNLILRPRRPSPKQRARTAPATQKLVAKELLSNLRKDILSILPKVPEDWDGIEVRMLVQRVVNERFSHRDTLKERYKAFTNTCDLKGLT